MNSRNGISALVSCALVLSTVGDAIAAEPSLATQIKAKRVFPSPIQWIGDQEPPDAESGDLLQAMGVFTPGGAKAGIAALETFVAAHSQSAWTPSVRANLAAEYHSRGRYSLALAHWEAVWNAMNGSRDARGQKLAVGAAAGRACLLAALGQRDKLEELLKELDARRLPLHSQATVVAAARARLATMKARPGDSYRCGVLALRGFAHALGQDGELKRRTPQMASPEGGFSLAELVGLAASTGIDAVAVRRPLGAELVIPCVVHWRLNHYAAILERRGERYIVLDPSFGPELWIDREVVEAESSGVFLLPGTQVPPDWKRLTAAESTAIQGSGYPNGVPDWDDGPPPGCGEGDDEDADCDPPSANDGAAGGLPPPPCCGGSGSGSDGDDDGSGGPDGIVQGDDPSNYPPLGGAGIVQGDDPSNYPPLNNGGKGDNPAGYGMPQWRVSEPYITLWLHDTPLRYRLSNGKWMQLKLNYKQRGDDPGGEIGGFGPNWHCNWLALLQSKADGLTPYALTNYLAGGGIQWFRTNGASDYKTARAAGGAAPVGGMAVETITSTPPPPPTPDTGGIVKFPVGDYKPIGGIPPVDIYVPITVHPPAPRLPQPDVFHPAGSQNRYEFSVGYGVSHTNYFLTHRLDRYGRAVLFNYQTNATLVRLASIVDPDGRTNRLYYTNALHPELVTSVVSPYGQTARFTYDDKGRLTNIVDAAGISSSFQYDDNHCITNMTTPYGQTAFRPVEGTSGPPYYSQNRALLVTEPTGQRQVYAYCDNGPIGVGGDGTPQYRNSYHWNRAQYEAMSEQGKANLVDMQAADYELAETKHWLHGDTSGSALTVSDTLGAMGGPKDPVFGYRSGLMWFIYQGQDPQSLGVIGTRKRVTEIHAASPDGQLMGITRNDLGRPLILTYYKQEAPLAPYSNTYDDSGSLLQTQTGPRSEMVRGYGYHPVLTNLLTSVTNALGEVIRYTHDTNTMKVTSITFQSGLVRTNIYYPNGASVGFLWQQIDLGLRTNSFGYTNGNLAAKTNELGLVTRYLWDSLNRLVCVTFPDNTTVSNLYDKLDLVGRKDRLDHWTWYSYNPVRQLTAVTNVNGQVTQYEYCSCGSPTRLIRWNGTRAITNEFSYDIAGRLTNTLYGDGYQVARAYDDRGLLTDVTDNGGRHLHVYEYDQLGLRYMIGTLWMVSSQYNDTRALLSNTRDEYGRVIVSTDRNGVIVTNGYDFLGRLTARQVFSQVGWQYGLPDTGRETFVYDSRGLTNYFDPLDHRTTFVRDAAGRVLYQTNANQEVLRFTYNPKGQLLTLTDGKNQTTTWHYDQYGRVTNKVDVANTEIFRYQYDPAGRLTNRWTAAKGNTGYGYDAIGNLLSIHYPLSTTSYAYDALNRLTNMVDAVGTTTFTWTDGNRLAAEDGPWASDIVGYGYNSRLRSAMSLTQPNASPWTQTYAHDDFGRLLNLFSPAGTFGYEYTGFDLVANLNLPTAGRIYNVHDGVGRLRSTTLQDPQQATINDHQYAYDMGSQRTQQVFTAGNYVDYTYDNIGQLKTAKGAEPDGQGGQMRRLHEQFGYAYDAAWNLNYRTNNHLFQTFGVNNLNELTTVSRSGTLTVAGAASERRANYEGDYGVTGVTVSGTGLSSGPAELYVDGAWARTNATLADGENTYTATAQDSYARTSQDSVTVNLPASASFSYDDNGNLLSDGHRNFEYDCENQLTNVYVSGQWRSEFAYDGLARRRIRREYTWQSGAWHLQSEIHYVYDGRVVIQERSASNLPQVSYTRGMDLSGDLQGAGGIGGLLARTDARLSAIGNSGAHAYYHADGNGNITCLINASNAVVARYTYDPYGNLLAMSGPLAEANLYRFSSKEYHPNSGTAYYLYRYYEPNLQRWLNRDPVDDLAFGAVHGPWLGVDRSVPNPFRFVRNRPMNAFDPLGLSPDKAIDDLVSGSLSMDDCLAGCDRLRQTDLSGVKSAWNRRGLPTMIAGGVAVIGAIATRIPHPIARVAGYIAIAAAGVYESVEWHHSSKEAEKDEKKVRDRFGNCCAACGDKWHDINEAMDHFQQTYPHWQE
jgi:RHS repeat-associated protein